jgi:hypothetical protein
MEDLSNRILPDLSDEELMEAYRQRMGKPTIEKTSQDFWLEFSRRKQEENARVMARWTKWVGIATIVNVLAVLYQILRSAGYFP